MSSEDAVDPAAVRGQRLNADCQAWLEEIAKGKETALASFYDATVNKAYGLALRITGSNEAAEEVIGDVYLQVWRDAKRYDAKRGGVMTWLLTICRSRALDCLRKTNKAGVGVWPQAFADPQADECDPAELLLDMERDAAIRDALQRLSPVQRQLVALAFFKDMSHSEIAQSTGLPLGTVKTHIRKSIGMLKDALGTEEP